MKTYNLSSSAISSVSYDESTKVMQIIFTGQSTAYDFCNVPLHILKGLINASSHGTYYNDHIRDRYQCY